jgi:Cysteine rich repeat
LVEAKKITAEEIHVAMSCSIRGGVARLGVQLLLLAGLAGTAFAQQPTSAEISAIKSNCRSDYQRYCASVPTGGSAALQCLEQNSSKLSGACQQAVNAAMGSSAPAPAAAAPAATTPAAAMPAATMPAATAAAMSSWPHTISANGATVVVYQPQAISWPEQTTLNARTALAITRKGTTKPIVGTIEFSGSTSTNFNTRMVTVHDLKLASSHFPSLDTGAAAELEGKLRQALAAMGPKSVPLDNVLLSLKEMPDTPATVTLSEEPPVIFHSSRPASLVVFDGEPTMAPAGKSGLTFAVNTNWDVFFDSASNGWYLLNNASWFTAAAYAGPWKPAGKLPAAFYKLPNDKNFAAVRKNVPGKPAKPETSPTIFVSTKPAEIIVTLGAPVMVAIPGTALQYVANTDCTLFLDADNGRFYYLVSGRWFSSMGLAGPWAYATPTLPADFALIPENSPRGVVLASVPGTAQAQQAIVEAGIPHQATLLRTAPAPTVIYAGTPQFAPIPGTALAYATNTAFEVISAGGKFYLCYQGAWFVGASPVGPWILADSIPSAIYAIPPSVPVYNVTYVRIYAVTPTTVVYGYTAGYTMVFVSSSASVVVYGTGYYYPPVVIMGPVPIYYPYPYSYAGSTWYNPATGAWARGGTIYGPYGGAITGGTAYNPQTGAWAHGAAVYGPNGGAGAWSAYNPTTGTYAHGSAVWGPDGGTAYGSFANSRNGMSGSTTQNWNSYERWGSSVINTPNQTIHTESGSNANGVAGGFSSSTGAQGAGVHTNNGNNAGIVKGQGGDVYAGADGNVYKKTDNGWEKYDNGSWTPVQPCSTCLKNGNGQNGNGQNGNLGQNGQGQQKNGQNGNGQNGNLGQNGQGQQQIGQNGNLGQGGQGEQKLGQNGNLGQGGQGAGNWNQLQQDWNARGQGQQRQQQYQGWRNGGSRGTLFRRP